MSEESVNIIFIHRGANDYLKFSLAQAHKSNPLANIFLIGDNGNRNISDFVKHYNIDDYFASALKLENVYQHFSCNSVEFELFCIQRWFVLLDFIKANKIEKFFYADSDVLIFSDLAREWSKFSNFSFTLSSGACGHNSFEFSSKGTKSKKTDGSIFTGKITL